MIRDDLLGAWTLVSFRQEDASGEVTFPLGEDAEGWILYTADGYMSAQIQRRGERRP